MNGYTTATTTSSPNGSFKRRAPIHAKMRVGREEERATDENTPEPTLLERDSRTELHRKRPVHEPTEAGQVRAPSGRESERPPVVAHVGEDPGQEPHERSGNDIVEIPEYLPAAPDEPPERRNRDRKDLPGLPSGHPEDEPEENGIPT